jgi:hypothetical protein
MFAYVFLVGYGEDGPYADSFLDASAALGHTPVTYQHAVDTAKRLGVDSTRLGKLPDCLAGISLRARMTMRALHMVKSEVPITIGELDALLRNKQSERTLKKFLKESEI